MKDEKVTSKPKKKQDPELVKRRLEASQRAATETTESRKKVFKAAYKKNFGNVAVSSRKTKIDRTTFYRWLKEDPQFAQDIDDIEESVIDWGESRLKSLMSKDGKGAVTATIFFLKTKGKRRGYVERSEHSFVNPFDGLTEEDLEKEIERLSDKKK